MGEPPYAYPGAASPLDGRSQAMARLMNCLAGFAEGRRSADDRKTSPVPGGASNIP